MGGKQSLERDLDEFSSLLRQLHAVRCCISAWAKTIEDVAAGRIALDLDDRTREYLRVAGALPGIRAGEVGLMVKDLVGALRRLADVLYARKHLIDEAHDKMLQEAKAIEASGPEPVGAPVEGGARVRIPGKWLAHVVDCPRADCDPETLAGVGRLIKQILANISELRQQSRDPMTWVYLERPKYDASLSDKRFDAWIYRWSEVLEKIARETPLFLTDSSNVHARMLRDARRSLDRAIEMRRMVAAEFGEILLMAAPPAPAE